MKNEKLTCPIPLGAEVYNIFLTEQKGFVRSRTWWLSGQVRVSVAFPNMSNPNRLEDCSFDIDEVAMVGDGGPHIREFTNQPALKIGDVVESVIIPERGKQVVIGLTQFRNGCWRIILQPQALSKNGEIFEISSEDEVTLKLVGCVAGLAQKASETRDRGGPRDDPPTSREPMDPTAKIIRGY